ncbi:hypothetical protein PUV54_00075 [Hyphococcus flavus]|uniref:Uncharacterized protein n=1 Tax=Hyphococcus flavus TaxID=1866326 RepID=A0AAE9ZJD3_9PROT|nr:hypothetical protein [Hyphococcus flavus]WDI31590.1 hypothetical protein PUV54_00075 [Hyphococcus flavus]
MAMITLPEAPIGWRVSAFGIERADAVGEFLNGAVQVTEYQRALWAGKISLPQLDGAARRQWRAALAQLAQLSNRFEMGPPDAQSGPSTGYAGPGLLVNGGSQLGTSIDIDNATAAADLLAAGDYFMVTAAGVKELKIATADATADGSGEATISFYPPLRNAPDDNAAVEIDAPVTAFRLTTPTMIWQNSLDGGTDFDIDFIEAFAP